MNELAFPLAMLATVIAITIVLAYVPQISQPKTPLGARVPADKLTHPTVRSAISRYKLYVIISGLLSAIATAAFSTSMPIISALSTLIVTAVSIGAYISQRKRIIEVKKSENWFQGAEFAVSGRVSGSISRQKAGDSTNIAASHNKGSALSLPDEKLAAIDALPQPQFPWIYILLSVFSLVVSVLIVATNWDSIPQVFATHWGPNMQPDAWSEKSIGSVFFGSFISLAIVIFMAGISAVIVKAQVHNRTDRSMRGQLRTQVMLAATTTGLGVTTLALSIGFALLQVTSVLPEYQHLMGWTFALMMVGALGSVIAMLIILASNQGKADDILRGVTFGDEAKESPDNDDFYKFGMFYYNPDDPAVLVEKRFGAGVDFNYAHWQGKVFMAVIIAILIGSFSLIFL